MINPGPFHIRGVDELCAVLLGKDVDTNIIIRIAFAFRVLVDRADNTNGIAANIAAKTVFEGNFDLIRRGFGEFETLPTSWPHFYV